MSELSKQCEWCGDEFKPASGHKNTIAYFKKRRFCSAKCAGMATAPEVENPVARFWSRVQRQANGCLEWQGARTEAGYGVMTIKGKTVTMHRLAWQIAHGPIPQGAHVLHRCDNPPCCDEDHLFLGDQRINNADRDAKGRTRQGPIRKGEAHHAAKLTEAIVVEIRSTSETTRALAARYGVTAAAIEMARNRKTWRHVA